MKMRRSSVLCRSAVIFLFIAASLVRCQNPPSYRLSPGVVPARYDLHIVVDLENAQFNGTVTIHAHANQPTSAIELHLLDLSTSDVQVMEGVSAVAVSDLRINNETQTLRIALARTVIGDCSITVSFEGEIKDDMKGLYRSSYYENQTVKFMATTFSAAAYARKIFPCFDEPAFKAPFRLAITNERKYVTVANTKVNDSEDFEMPGGEVWQTTRFETTPVMSTYLLAFAVSEFVNITEQSSTDFSVFSSQTAISSMRYALDTGREALSTLEDFVGLSYDLGKMDFIAIDDFLMGAMENWGLVSFKSSRIMRPEGKRNLRKVQEITNIITHELVHMFFGNQVTCDYWDYVWLNEGFASYLEYVIADKIRPSWRILDYFVVNRMHQVMLQDVKPKTHPMTRLINTPEEISKIYDFVAYPKAASVIRMIEHVMTAEVFQKALGAYVFERSYKTATDEQLFESLERVRREHSDSNYPPLPEVFRSWANQAGFPILNVEVSRESRSAKVSQELAVPVVNLTESSEFYILFNYATLSSGFGNTSATGWLHKEAEVQHPLVRMADDDKWVIFNVKQTGYYRVNYDTQNWNAIIDELNGPNFSSIDTLNRAQLLDDSFNLARHGYLDFGVALNLIKYLREEHELVPLIAGFKAIEFLLTFVDQEDFFADLRDIMLEIVDDVYVRLNNASLKIAPEDEEYHVLTKLQVNLFACRFGVKSCLDDAITKLVLFDYQQNELDVNERPYSYCGILAGPWAGYSWVQLGLKISLSNKNEALYRDKQEEFNEIFYAFSACDPDISRVETILNSIISGGNNILQFESITRENALQVVGNLIKASSARRSLVLQFYSNNFEEANEKAPFKETISMFAEAINSRAHLERFISLASTADLEVSETVAEIERNIRWMELKAPEIAKWTASMKGAAINLKASTLIVMAFIFMLLANNSTT